MRENDEITGLFRSRLAGAEMTVREDFWEGLQRDLPSPVAAKGRRPLFLSPRVHRVAAAAAAQPLRSLDHRSRYAGALQKLHALLRISERTAHQQILRHHFLPSAASPDGKYFSAAAGHIRKRSARPTACRSFDAPSAWLSLHDMQRVRAGDVI